MKLSEKILSLRTAMGLSQGDLAEKLEVSRQSVSTWETGQSVPDLDKIIKLADLFGVSVDELVREGERPEPQQGSRPEPQIVYVERDVKWKPNQFVGLILEVLGIGCFLLGFLTMRVVVALGVVLMILGLPLLFVGKHPWLACGWLLSIGSYVVVNPWNSGVSLRMACWMIRDGYFTLTAIVGLARAALLAVMLISTCVMLK